MRRSSSISPRSPDPALTEAEALRCQELIGACVKLEQVGDIIVRNMLAHVQKKFERGLEFTDEGWRELAAFHASVLANARLAFNVLVSRDPETARQLVREKDRLRDLEKETSQSHFVRLRDGTAKSVETSSIHLDTIRDLKQINSLLASMAYPVLEERGPADGFAVEGRLIRRGRVPLRQSISTCRSISSMLLTPVSAIETSSSLRMISIALATPACPPAPRP